MTATVPVQYRWDLNGTDLPRKQPASYGSSRAWCPCFCFNLHHYCIPGIFFANPSHRRNLFNSPCHLFVTKMGPIRTLNRTPEYTPYGCSPDRFWKISRSGQFQSVQMEAKIRVHPLWVPGHDDSGYVRPYPYPDVHKVSSSNQALVQTRNFIFFSSCVMCLAFNILLLVTAHS